MNPSAAIEIDAPLAAVWAIMLDTDRYADWNPFVVRAETSRPAAVGNPIVLHVVWADGKRTRAPERITALEGPVTDPASGTTTARMSAPPAAGSESAIEARASSATAAAICRARAKS